MLKRGQGLPLNTIIIAVIVLIVLVILIVIFTGKIGFFGKSLDECAAGQNRCVDSATDCDQFGPNTVAIPVNCLPDKGVDYCCTGVGE